MRPYQCLDAAAYKKFLEALRADRCIEYGMRGYPAIGEWLVKMRFLPKVPSPWTLRRWRRDAFLPVVLARVDGLNRSRRDAYTTNLMLHAWMATQGRMLFLPRWHPQSMTQVYKRKRERLSTNPNSIRARRAWEKKKRAEALARSQEPTPASPILPGQVGRVPRGYEPAV